MPIVRANTTVTTPTIETVAYDAPDDVTFLVRCSTGRTSSEAMHIKTPRQALGRFAAPVNPAVATIPSEIGMVTRTDDDISMVI